MPELRDIRRTTVGDETDICIQASSPRVEMMKVVCVIKRHILTILEVLPLEELHPFTNYELKQILPALWKQGRDGGGGDRDSVGMLDGAMA